MHLGAWSSITLALLCAESSAASVPSQTLQQFSDMDLSKFMSKLLKPRAVAQTQKVSNVSVIFPAYIYPVGWTTPGAWDPLYNALQHYPYINYHIVVNPNSGPGGRAPNSDYAQAITKLKSYPNALLLGYIHTSWGSRSSDDVYSDVNQYQAWRTQGLGMDGIFYDETPTAATDVLYNYMNNVTCYAKTTLTHDGSDPLIYFNPGTIPDIRYYGIADRMAVFEDTYPTFLKNQQNFQTGTKLPMKKSAFLINSLSSGWNQTQVNSLVSSLVNGDQLGSLYLTSNTDQSNPYGAFADDWTTFIAAIEALRVSN